MLDIELSVVSCDHNNVYKVEENKVQSTVERMKDEDNVNKWIKNENESKGKKIKTIIITDL